MRDEAGARLGSITGVMLSGGLDSCIVLAHLLAQRRQVQPFYIRTGVNWERCELVAAEQFLKAVDSPLLLPLIKLELPLRDIYGQHWSLTGTQVPDAVSPDEAVFLPGRNALLMVKAVVWCQLNGVDELALATLGTSPFADASVEFVNRFQDAMSFGAARPVRIVLPFADQGKRAVMELGRQLPLHFSFSCIAPVAGLHCGKCNKCEERRQSFRRAEMEDLTNYYVHGD